jgi:hypothetical protein
VIYDDEPRRRQHYPIWSNDQAAHKRHLLTHAAAMGGWLSASYVHSYDGIAADLIGEGLAEWATKDGRMVFQLTDAGQARAGELGGAR